MLKPKPLKSGDLVAIVAPGSPLSEEKLETAVRSVEFLGLRAQIYPSCRPDFKLPRETGKPLNEELLSGVALPYLSGPDFQRAKDIQAAFEDPEIKAIFCLRGGYGCSRILPLLNYEAIARNPKILLGYSDITALHTVINQRCGMVTFHGPMLNTDWNEMDPVSMESLRQALFSPEGQPKGIFLQAGAAPEKKPRSLNFLPEEMHLRALLPGSAEGLSAGGNLTLLAATLGSPYEIDTLGKILFLEDVDLRPYQLDRAIQSLALAGKFRDCTGIVLCHFTDCHGPGFPPPTQKEKVQSGESTLDQIFYDILKPFGKPVLAGFPAGHSFPNLTVPLGVPTQINGKENKISFAPIRNT